MKFVKFKAPQRLVKSATLISILAFSLHPGLAQEPAALTIPDLIQGVLNHNESVQVRVLEAEIGRRTEMAEHGIFEPQVTGSIERVDSNRPNNAQQIAALGLLATPFLSERNTLYNGGVEWLSPLGTKIRGGFAIRDLNNNIQQRGGEVETFVGATVTQPLLKNAGRSATMARIRLAAVASDIAFQEYRKQLMLVVSQAESAYWDLYLMQQQEEISLQSVAIASKIYDDSKARVEVGRAAQVEVMEAAASLSQRKAKHAESRHRVMESISRLTSFYLDPVIITNPIVRAVDIPQMEALSFDQAAGAQDAYTFNPDFLIRQQRLRQDEVRLSYAKNQRRPQVDVKGAYGFNGLGRNLGGAIDQIDDAQFPVWSLGVELNIPITGGVRERNELAAAKLGRSRSMVAVEEAAVQISSALAAGFSKVRTFEENLINHQALSRDLAQLLDAQITKFEGGSLESRWVLETLDKWSEARILVIEDRVQYRRAALELELIRGATLHSRGLEITKYELQKKTRSLLDEHQWDKKIVSDYQRRAQTELEKQYKAQ